MICHYCEGEAEDIVCEHCDLPTCEDCCVVMTYHNQIDYPKCLACEDETQNILAEENHKKWAEEQKQAEIKKRRAEVRHANWIKPENVAKRLAAKKERQRLKAEARKRAMEESAAVVYDMFKGMF